MLDNYITSEQSLSERLYYHEMSTWSSLSGQLQLILAILIVHIGFSLKVGESLIIDAFVDQNFSIFTILIWSLYGGGIVKLFNTLISFWKGWHGYEYPVMITADELRKHRKTIYEQYNGYENQAELAKKGFDKVLEEKFSEYASIAAVNNGKKYTNLYNCKLTLIPSVVLICFTYMLLKIF